MKSGDRKLSDLFRPAAQFQSNSLAMAVLPLLAMSALLLVLAAWAMPPEYSWRSNSVSESAAQGQLHGWIARLCFLSFGVAVLSLSIAMRRLWPRITYWCGLVFAASMCAVAAFSQLPWEAEIEGDAFEGLLHSIFASSMGLAFALGVAARFVHRGPGALWGRALDVIALFVATLSPLVLASGPSAGGVVQRIMFVVGYIWFGREAFIGRSNGVVEHAA